jgi:DNA primase
VEFLVDVVRPFGNELNRAGGKKWFDPVQPLPGANARRIGGGGVDPLYGRAIMAGLLRHPAMVATCAEALSMLVIEDGELDRLRSILLEAAYASPLAVPGVESGGIDTIFARAGLSALVESLRRANGLAFSFTRGEADAETARRDLALAIEALASRPELDAALEAATARLAMGPDADGFAEQMRLIAARAEADRALAALSGDEDD